MTSFGYSISTSAIGKVLRQYEQTRTGTVRGFRRTLRAWHFTHFASGLGLDAQGHGHAWSIPKLMREGLVAAQGGGPWDPTPAEIMRYGLMAAAGAESASCRERKRDPWLGACDTIRPWPRYQESQAECN